MQMTIKKWGNSLATRIPKTIADSIGLHYEQNVEIEAVEGKIVITPIKKSPRKEYALDDLLSKCDSQSVSLNDEEREWLEAAPVGKEIW